jgi:MFS family permease
MNLSKNIKILSWFNFLFNFRLYSVVAIIYFAQVTHSYALAISIFSITQIAQAIFEVPTGIYSDKIGRVNSLKLGAIASILSIAFYAIGQFYWVLVIGAIFEGICRAFFNGNNDALLYETVKDSGEKIAFSEALGKVSSILELAGFLGTILAGVIAFKSFSLLMWLSVIPQVLALAVSFGFVEPPIHREKIENIYSHLKDALSYYKNNIKFRDLSLAKIIGYGIGNATWSFQSAFYNSVLPLWIVGFVMSLNFLASVISYRLSGRIIAKFKELNLLIFQEIYSRALDLIALAYPTFVSPFLMAAASIFYGSGVVAESTLLQKEFSDKQRATLPSINSLEGNVFFSIFAVLTGFLADRLGIAKSLLIAQICLIPVLFLYIKAFRFDKKSAIKLQ